MPEQPYASSREQRLNAFDRLCVIVAFPVGIGFLFVGLPGCFMGANLNLTLPPVLGGLVFLAGWGILKAIIVAWQVTREDEEQIRKRIKTFRSMRNTYLDPDDMITFDVSCSKCKYNLRGLSEYGTCPECGHTIVDSLDDDMVRRIEAK